MTVSPARSGVVKLITHPGAQNFAWLVADKGLRLLVGLGVGSWVARYLGAADFGLFAYVAALIAIVVGIAGLGMDALVVRDIIHRPAEARVLLGTTIIFRMIAGLVGVVALMGIVQVFRPDHARVWPLLLMLGIGTIFQGLDSGELWFQAKVQMRRLLLPRMALFFAMNGVKVWLVIQGADLTAFVALTAAELLSSGCLTYAFVRWSANGAGRPIVDWHKGVDILRESWPLALSGLVVILYIKISQLLLAGLLDDAALGVYSAALRISEAANFIPMVLASSLLPSLMKHRSEGPAIYRLARLRYFRLNALLALGLSLPLCIGAPWIVGLLYGAEYAGATPVLAVHAWTLVFAFLGVARGQHILNERKTHWALRFAIWGLLANVGLGLWLIPRFGPVGAAWATLLAYALSSLGTSFVYAPTREVGREQLLALTTPWWAFRQVAHKPD
jgi:PST family polysaccharide transporter